MLDYPNITPLSEAYEPQPIDDNYAENMDIIEAALEATGKERFSVDNLPTYYDDMLRQLIDAVPLE